MNGSIEVTMYAGSGYNLNCCLLLHNSLSYIVIDLFAKPESGVLLRYDLESITKIDTKLVLLFGVL